MKYREEDGGRKGREKEIGYQEKGAGRKGEVGMKRRKMDDWNMKNRVHGGRSKCTVEGKIAS